MESTDNSTSPTFTEPLKEDMKFGFMLDMLPDKGNLAWEYNPFRNYRLQESAYYFRNKYLSKSELLDELGAKDGISLENAFDPLGHIIYDINDSTITIGEIDYSIIRVEEEGGYYELTSAPQNEEELNNILNLLDQFKKIDTKVSDSGTKDPLGNTIYKGEDGNLLVIKIKEKEYSKVYKKIVYTCYKLNSTPKDEDDIKNQWENLNNFKKESTLLEIPMKSATSWDIFKNPEFCSNPIQSNEEDPIFYDKNQLIDFDTSELSFDIHNPVDILPQYSYDGSVNLIINDGKNTPKLINSRFSPLGRNKYLIVDRKGNNDTNIYDLGEQFLSDTSLYKTYTGIPELDFINVYLYGNLGIGNYHFYFKYADADGNETDFVAESGLVSIFKGTLLSNITSGFRSENSYKSVKFLLSNIDPAYSYVHVYYTVNTSDIWEHSTVSAYKIELNFIVNNSLVCSIYITGNEQKTEIPITDINPIYLLALNVNTLAVCQNRLFFGNIHDYDINYAELADLSLRFTASPTTKDYVPVDHSYNNVITDTYSDPKFIYNYTGYLNKELYRFGIVYLMNNGKLSPVFNIRGKFFSEKTDVYNDFPVYKDKSRLYITYNEENGIIYLESSSGGNILSEGLENAYGVVRIETGNNAETLNIIGIQVEINDSDILFKELSKYDIKGYFFVRLKRIPLRICQALTIGIDAESNIPLLYTKTSNFNTDSAVKLEDLENCYIAERFLSDTKELCHSFEDHVYAIDPMYVYKYGAICPDYDINSPYLNSIFNGNEYIIELISNSEALILDSTEGRHFYLEPDFISSGSIFTAKIVGVEDNTKLIEIDGKKFSARAGEAEEAFRFECIVNDIKTTDSTNLVRGSFGPYIAFEGYKSPNTLVNIYTKDYVDMSKYDLLKIRVEDKSPFYAISDRFSIQDIRKSITLYRGDTYICTFTHRVNRNFLDPSAPTNHKLVDPDCWKDNYEVSDGVIKVENFEKINLGDVNAVKLGMWVTFSLVSSNNLNIRALNDSIPDEIALTGHPRSFYPYSGMSADGVYKIPEALCFNEGFSKSLSERLNFECPDVPAIKNDFTNRISYSDIHVNDAFKNGFRIFQGGSYRDYPKTYGQITKLIELRGNLLCVFEHGIALIPVNERAVAGEGGGGNIYINTSNVLPENPKILSDTFGSQWRESIIKTPKGVYGVDTVAKKIWRTNGVEFGCISDFNIQEFLNLNISLTERELEPIIGVRNVKTHYNKFKGDVMFTFYDNLYGFEEKVWNVCFNETLEKWITFYSWLPSYSENIYNLYFSFDRNTSKWIAKLGISKSDNDFADGIVLSTNTIPNDAKAGDVIGTLDLVNRSLSDDITKTYELDRDNFGNWKNFEIVYDEDTGKWQLRLKTDAINLCSEFFIRGYKNTSNGSICYDNLILDPTEKTVYSSKLYNISEEKDANGNIKYTITPILSTSLKTIIENGDNVLVTKDGNTITELIVGSNILWRNKCVLNGSYSIVKDDTGKRLNLSNDKRINGTSPVILLNIKCNITTSYNSDTASLKEAYLNGINNSVKVDAGYYQSVVAVIPLYNILFLTTDFWKHGLAGIIDIADKIYPTYWYGKLHPFEFEFVMADTPSKHKIFDNLLILSNKAAPESFHYEIVGECYDFAKDKENMYIRQEATKELYQYNGSDILFDRNYKDIDSVHRPAGLWRDNSKYFDKSTILPLYYSRLDTFNEIEDYYHLYGEKDRYAPSDKNFSALAGGEIVRYKTLNEYRIWNHTKGVDISKEGPLRGNMYYKEDIWDVLINPLNIVLRNEKDWGSDGESLILGDSKLVPVEINQCPIPDDIKDLNNLETPDDWLNRGLTIWRAKEVRYSEAKLKDKYIKIRIRYSGEDLAIISAIKTLFSISYT